MSLQDPYVYGHHSLWLLYGWRWSVSNIFLAESFGSQMSLKYGPMSSILSNVFICREEIDVHIWNPCHPYGVLQVTEFWELQCYYWRRLLFDNSIGVLVKLREGLVTKNLCISASKYAVIRKNGVWACTQNHPFILSFSIPSPFPPLQIHDFRGFGDPMGMGVLWISSVMWICRSTSLWNPYGYQMLPKRP